MNVELTAAHSEESFRAMYAAMSDDEILELAGQGGLMLEAEAALAEQLRLRGISAAAVDAARQRQQQARLQVQVGRNPYWKFKGTGLRFRGKTFRSAEDEAQGIAVQTRWVMLWWLSLVPLGSYRVKPVPKKAWEYQILSREPLELKQVLAGWLQTTTFVVLVLCVVVLGRWLRHR